MQVLRNSIQEMSMAVITVGKRLEKRGNKVTKGTIAENPTKKI